MYKKINKATPNPVDLEHVLNFIVNNPKRFRQYNYKINKNF